MHSKKTKYVIVWLQFIKWFLIMDCMGVGWQNIEVMFPTLSWFHPDFLAVFSLFSQKNALFTFANCHKNQKHKHLPILHWCLHKWYGTFLTIPSLHVLERQKYLHVFDGGLLILIICHIGNRIIQYVAVLVFSSNFPSTLIEHVMQTLFTWEM